MRNEYGTLKRVALRHARAAFGGPSQIEDQWRPFGYADAVDFERACVEYDAFAQVIEESGARIEFLPDATGLGLDGIYVRDPCIMSSNGLVICNMSKPERMAEAGANADHLQAMDLSVAGSISGAGRLEGGDLVWIDETKCAVGLGHRTNAAGVSQLMEILGPRVHVETVQLPRHGGPAQVFHLMSIVSPLDRDLALIFAPLMPTSFREWLVDQGLTLVEVPPEEFETLGCNVLALGPRKVVMLAGNPATQKRLEAAGCDVRVYDGREISIKGCGGPTCLTMPLARG